MSEYDIGKVLRKLHGDSIEEGVNLRNHKVQLVQINEKLISVRPNMHLMFAKISEYKAVMPGFITVPMQFKLDDLAKFLDESIHVHAKRTAEYV
jgi:hypothetical protein